MTQYHTSQGFSILDDVSRIPQSSDYGSQDIYRVSHNEITRNDPQAWREDRTKDLTNSRLVYIT